MEFGETSLDTCLHVTQNARGVQGDIRDQGVEGDIRDQDNHVAKDGRLGSWVF